MKIENMKKFMEFKKNLPESWSYKLRVLAIRLYGEGYDAREAIEQARTEGAQQAAKLMAEGGEK